MRLKQIFDRVCVCHSFQLSGLQAILKTFPTEPPIEDHVLTWITGELNRAEYIMSENQYHIIRQEKKISEFFLKLEEPSYCSLNKAWLEWYESKYRRYFRVYDLASLLFHHISYYHDTPYHKACEQEKNSILDHLQSEVEKHLWEYCWSKLETLDESRASQYKSLSQAFGVLGHKLPHPVREEAVHYVRNLKELIEEIELFDRILLRSEKEAFMEYLKSLEP